MVKILSDSASLYSKSTALAHGIDISSLIVTVNNTSYREYEDIHTPEFIDHIKAGHIPTSSQPSIGDVVDLYAAYPDDEIINITIADGLSGTYHSACMAREMDPNPERIHVINSKTLCGPQNYLVNLATALSHQGKSAREILDVLEVSVDFSRSYLIPHDFDYLVRGGRLSPLVGKIGGMIKLVVVTRLTDDGKTLDKFAATRGSKKAVQKVAQDMIDEGIGTNHKIYISHALREDLALEAKEVILSMIPNADIELLVLGPAFTTQGGPGCLAIQWVQKHPLLEQS